jgi:hypothetical protein
MSSRKKLSMRVTLVLLQLGLSQTFLFLIRMSIDMMQMHLSGGIILATAQHQILSWELRSIYELMVCLSIPSFLDQAQTNSQ